MLLKTLNLITLCLTVSATLSAQVKKPLDHDVYDIWNTITQQAISRDGQWVSLSVGPEEKDRELRVKHLDQDRIYRVARGQSAVFSADSRFVVTMVKAFKDSVTQGKRDKLKPDKMPKDSLGIVTLEDGQVDRIGRVKSFKMPPDAGGWVAYLLEKALPDSAASDSSAVEGEEGEKAKEEEGKKKEGSELVPEKEEPLKQEPAKKEQKEKEPEKKEESGESEKDKKKDEKDKKKAEGTDLVLRNLESGDERVFEDVVSYDFSKVGNWLVFATASKDSSADGIRAVQIVTGDSVSILEGPGDYKGTVIDSSGTQVAFVTNRDSFAAKQPEYALYHWNTKSRKLRDLAREETKGVPAGWWVSEHGKLSFSQDGKRLFFGTSPRPEPEPEEEVPEDEKVVLDVWHWKDPILQPNQLKELKDELKRSYSAVVHLKNARVVQLATKEMPILVLGNQGNADVSLGISREPYRQLISWDWPRYYDAYLVDMSTGQTRQFATKQQHRPALSPEAQYAFWYDRDDRAWFAMDVKKPEVRKISTGIPHPLHNEDHDMPSTPGSYGSSGWTKGDKGFLINDRHDIWLADPKGKARPRNLTAGAGRADSLRFRYVRLNTDERSRDLGKPVLLSAFNYKTKAAGFYRLNSKQGPPERLVMEDRRFTNPKKAKNADRFLLTRSTFEEFPDLCISDPDFKSVRKVTDVNPQQKDYLWGSSELVEWSSLDGVRLQGILYKPENFDPNKKYPMIVYFYERLSRILHWYSRPRAIRSVIVPSFYTSRDYLVFIPDIRYKHGFPGESAINCVIPGVTHLIDQGFVQEDRIGVQGHSWGGYQIAYMVTRSNIFAAAEAGAPVSNMTSAYGGIRWGSGLSRMMQYEKSQSRIGGSLWEAPTRYIENSPVFWADKVRTPLLMMHNDKDGAVPWYQGIEMFVALRRLGKPVWMLNYNGEEHGLKKRPNKRDFTIRMQQFFDHYLKGAPAPVWLAEGVPAIEKGKTLGLELIEE
jgi:acetyl esterase/lipase